MIFMQNNKFHNVIDYYIDKIIKNGYDRSKRNLKVTKILHKITSSHFAIVPKILYLLGNIKIV